MMQKLKKLKNAFFNQLNTIRVQLTLLVLIPQLVFTIFSINYFNQISQKFTDQIASFSSSMYSEQIFFVQKQNDATLFILHSLMQKDTVNVNTLWRLNQKMMNGVLHTNPKFVQSLLNLDHIYNNYGDQDLLNLYKKNSSLLISSWYSGDTKNLQELSQLSQDQIRNTSFIDFFWRSTLYDAKHNVKQFQVKINLKSFFIAFQYDGMFYGSGTNMTSQKAIEPNVCQKATNYFDQRCQEYYQIVTKVAKNTLGGYLPTHFLLEVDSKPYIAIGLCKKTFVNERFMQKYKVPSNLKNKINPFSLTCHSINLEDSNLNFQKVGNQKAIRILLDPFKQRVAFQSDRQIQPNQILTLQESYLYQIESDELKQYFLKQIQDFITNFFQQFCSSDKTLIFSSKDKQKTKQFTLQVQDQKIIVIMQFTFFIDKNYEEKQDVEIESSFCFESSLLLLTILTQDQLQSQAISLNKQISEYNLYFKCLIYGLISFSTLISYYYSQNISKMIGDSLEHLTNILKKLKVDQETKNFILFEDGMISGDFQIDHSELILSSDLCQLYDSFQNLFQTLIYTTQSLFDQDESLTLITLTKQISYFQQFKNYRALGICYNNIANIHFNNSRYLEALENYGQSIVCCKYEQKVYQHHQFQSQFRAPESQSQIYREKSNRSSLFKSLIQKINSIELFKSKFKDYMKHQKLDFKSQKDLIDNFSKYGIYEIMQEKQELQQMLFNRKYNFIRALIFYKLNLKNLNQFSDIIENLAIELVNLRSSDQVESCKQKIMINQIFQSIYFFKGDQQKCQQIVAENNSLLSQIKQTSIINRQKSQRDDKTIPKEVISQHSQQINCQTPQLSFHDNLYSDLPTKLQSPQSSQTNFNLKPNKQQNDSFQIQNIQIKSQNNSALNAKYQEESFTNFSLNTQQFKSINHFLKENQVLESQSPEQTKQKPSILKKGSKENKKEEDQFSQNRKIAQICETPIKMSQMRNLGYSSSVKKKKLASPKTPQSYYKEKQLKLSQLNSSQSPKIAQSTKLNRFNSPKHQLFISRKSKTNLPLNSNSTYLKQLSHKNLNNSLNQSTQKAQSFTKNSKHIKLQKSLQNNVFSGHASFVIINKSYDCDKKSEQQMKVQKKQSNNFTNNDNQKSQNNQQNGTLEKENCQQYSSFLSNRSKAILQFDGFGDDRNQYFVNEDQIFTLVQEQISIMYLLQKNYYKAAKEITKIYEKSKLVISQSFNRNIQRLLSIFEIFGLNCSFLESFYQKLTLNLSFKICVVYINFEEDQDFNNSTELQESYLFQTQYIDQLTNKAKLIELLLDIIEQVVYRENDFFGFISSNLNSMNITEHVSVVSNIKKNEQVIKDSLFDFLKQTELNNIKAQYKRNKAFSMNKQQQKYSEQQQNKYSFQIIKNQASQDLTPNTNESRSTPIKKIDEALAKQTLKKLKEFELNPVNKNIDNKYFNTLNNVNSQSNFENIIQQNEYQAKSFDNYNNDDSTTSQINYFKTFQTNTQLQKNKQDNLSMPEMYNSIQIQKESIALDIDQNANDSEENKTKQLSPIKEEMSKRFICDDFEAQQNKLQKNKDNIFIFLNNRRSSNKDSIQISLNYEESLSNYLGNESQQDESKKLHENKFKNPVFSTKLKSTKLDQILFNQQEQKNYETIKNIDRSLINKKKKTLFYFTIRKALQQVASQYDGLPIILQMKIIEHQKNMVQKYQAAAKKYYEQNKKEFIKNIFFQTNQKKNQYKKFIIAIIDNQSIIDQDEQEFQFLLANLKNLNVELCVLIQDEQISINEKNYFKSKYLDQTCVLSYFYSQQSLLLYLLNYRSTKCYGYVPLIVEHF